MQRRGAPAGRGWGSQSRPPPQYYGSGSSYRGGRRAWHDGAAPGHSEYAANGSGGGYFGRSGEAASGGLGTGEASRGGRQQQYYRMQGDASYYEGGAGGDSSYSHRYHSSLHAGAAVPPPPLRGGHMGGFPAAPAASSSGSSAFFRDSPFRAAASGHSSRRLFAVGGPPPSAADAAAAAYAAEPFVPQRGAAAGSRGRGAGAAGLVWRGTQAAARGGYYRGSGSGRGGRGSYYSNYSYVSHRDGPRSSRGDYHHEGAMVDVEGVPLPPSTYCRNFAFGVGSTCSSPSHLLRLQRRFFFQSRALHCWKRWPSQGEQDDVAWARHRWALISTEEEEGAAAEAAGARGGQEVPQRQQQRRGSTGGTGAAGAGAAAAAGRRLLWIDFSCIAETPLGSEASTMMFVEGVLFVGLQNGLVKAFLQDGSLKDLQRHTAAVHCVLPVDGALCSAGWDGRVCLWKYRDGDFLLFKELLLQEGGVTCVRDITVRRDAGALLSNGSRSSSNASAPRDSADAAALAHYAEQRLLWVGGLALNVLDAAALTVLRTINIEDAKPAGSIPLVLALVAYESNMLVGFSSGVIKAFTAEGEQLFRYDGQCLSTMEGLLSPDGPILMYGGADGTLHALRLPQFQELGQLTAHEDGDVKAIKYASDDFFFTCGEDSVICIWQWNRDAEQ